MVSFVTTFTFWKFGNLKIENLNSEHFVVRPQRVQSRAPIACRSWRLHSGYLMKMGRGRTRCFGRMGSLSISHCIRVQSRILCEQPLLRQSILVVVHHRDRLNLQPMFHQDCYRLFWCLSSLCDVIALECQNGQNEAL